MEKPAKTTAFLELHVPDFEKAKEYYGKLGFKTIWERKPDGFKGYLVLKMQNNVLCMWGGNNEIYNHPYLKKYSKTTKRGYGVEIVLVVKNVAKLYEKVKDFVNVVEPLVIQPWGVSDFRIEDPFGFYIRISDPYNTLHPKYAIK